MLKGTCTVTMALSACSSNSSSSTPFSSAFSTDANIQTHHTEGICCADTTGGFAWKVLCDLGWSTIRT